MKKLQAYVDSDIIHFHGVHGGFFSYLALPSLTEGKPGVITLRDMWPFTGHCGFSFDCDRWKIGCGKCPYPDAPPALPSKRDTTHLEYKLKEWIYSRSNFTIVSLDTWMTKLAQQSMLKRFPIHQIPNGVDTDVYSPLDRDLCRSVLGIPKGKKVMLYAAANLSRWRKGSDSLVKALRYLPESLKADVVLILLGERGEAIAEAIEIPSLVLGYVEGDRLKSVAYSATDMFLLPTRAEGLPNVLLESMACGTPMVSFAVGGVPDVVRPGVTGYLAESENVQDFCKGMMQLLEDDPLRESMRSQCRMIALEEYSAELETQRHIELYHKLLSNRGASTRDNDTPQDAETHSLLSS